MDSELQTYYETLLDLTGHSGWSLFVEEVKTKVEALEKVSTVRDDKDLVHRQGQLLVMNDLLNLRETLERTYQELTEND